MPTYVLGTFYICFFGYQGYERRKNYKTSCTYRTWDFPHPPINILINSLTINSVFINRAEHHGFLLTTTKIRVVPDVPWCWEARLQWPSFDPRQILCYY